MLTAEKLKKLRELAKKSHSHITVYGKEPEFIIVESSFMLELLDEVERLRAQVEKLKDAWEIVVEKNMELEAQAAAIREALEFYAEDSHWEFPTGDELCDGTASSWMSLTLADKGEKAKKTLSADAGREILERLRKLEQVAEITRVYKDIVDSLIYSLNADWENRNEHINVIYSWLKRVEDVKIELNKALAALEGGSE